MAWGEGRRVRPVKVSGAEASFEREPGGVIRVRSPYPLGPYPERLTDRLEEWAARTPDRNFLCRRNAEGEWAGITYAETLQRARCVAGALRARGLDSRSMVAILSGNSVEHALLALGCLYAGVPYTPIAPAYSLASKDLATLRNLWERLEPALVFAAEGERFEKPLEQLLTPATELVTVTPPVRLAATAFRDLLAAEALEAPGVTSPDAVAKVLFTSGSTGRPKGVITTHRMLSSNMEMIRTHLGFLAEEPPILCDWLPWNHVFGGSHNVGITLYNGGTMYMDEGKPTPAGFETTLRNLREIAPTAYFNVPRGYELLLPALRADEALRRNFFSRVKLLFYAAAGLSQRIWDELQDLAFETCGEEILMMTGLGSTETAPSAMFTGAEGASAGRLGLPVRGVEIKLAPVDEKLEVRVKGPSVTPGFWRDPALTAAAFDEEGFYRMGDAVTFADPADPLKGFLFDGRLAEDFKLSTGTWVSVGPLRNKVLSALRDLAVEVVIAGPDRDFVTALVFPLPGATREALQARLTAVAAESTGISTRVARALILDQPPSIDAGELTEKGSISQKAVLKNRAALVEELYSGSPRVMVI